MQIFTPESTKLIREVETLAYERKAILQMIATKTIKKGEVNNDKTCIH